MMSVISESNQLKQSGTDIIEDIRFATDTRQSGRGAVNGDAAQCMRAVNATVLMKLLSGLCYDLEQFAESSLRRAPFGRIALTLSHKSKRE
jgi:hypothetical protein